jgi:hypothetical protein
MNTQDIREQVALNIMQAMADTIDGDSSNKTAYAYADNIIALIDSHTNKRLVDELEEVRENTYSFQDNVTITDYLDDRINTLTKQLKGEE